MRTVDPQAGIHQSLRGGGPLGGGSGVRMDGGRREDQNRRREHREVAETGRPSVREGEVAMREAFEA